MSYTELESGYQGLRQQNRPGFYVGHDGNITYVSSYTSQLLFLDFATRPTTATNDRQRSIESVVSSLNWHTA